MDYEIVTGKDLRPDLHEEATGAFREAWPEFIFHDATAKRYLPRVEKYFPQYSIVVLHQERVAAGGWGVPLTWDGTTGGLPEGHSAALAAAVETREEQGQVNAFSFMGAVVVPGCERRGLARLVLEELLSRARHAGLDAVIAPVRPTWKQRYPLVGMAEYATWVRTDGLSIDPWIRLHQRMGATILAVAPNSTVVEGTVAAWEAWADMPFPTSGSYVVPGALNLLEVDRENDRAAYREENLWMQHR